MTFNLNEWLNVLFRWAHVFAGILWVGTTFYFTWLDGRFAELERAFGGQTSGNPDKSGKHVWMVHSGGFYLVEKQKAPHLMPEKLHWFRWEAAFTWLSGMLLLGLVYYHGGLLEDFEGGRISARAAIWLSLGLLAAGWVVYDLLWSSKIGKHESLGVVICYGLVVLTAWFLFQYFSRRAACLQLGAMMGTIMTANVWMRILPPQRRMVAALKEGRAPNQEEALRAKARSKHNTFIVVPVVFLMLSNHFPGTYDWRIISVLVLVGWFVATWLRRA
ncbi:MAG TPA: urate hydroxylase PuuD [Verrucomicrobiae bacterium]|nr:urate hydroxylase PuuD [Verrucomicrobiae bacterium]